MDPSLRVDKAWWRGFPAGRSTPSAISALWLKPLLHSRHSEGVSPVWRLSSLKKLELKLKLSLTETLVLFPSRMAGGRLN